MTMDTEVNRTCYCHCCGENIRLEDAVWDDGEPYCKGCDEEFKSDSE